MAPKSAPRVFLWNESTTPEPAVPPRKRGTPPEPLGPPPSSKHKAQLLLRRRRSQSNGRRRLKLLLLLLLLPLPLPPLLPGKSPTRARERGRMVARREAVKFRIKCSRKPRNKDFVCSFRNAYKGCGCKSWKSDEGGCRAGYGSRQWSCGSACQPRRSGHSRCGSGRTAPPTLEEGRRAPAKPLVWSAAEPA